MLSWGTAQRHKRPAGQRKDSVSEPRELQAQHTGAFLLGNSLNTVGQLSLPSACPGSNALSVGGAQSGGGGLSLSTALPLLLSPPEVKTTAAAQSGGAPREGKVWEGGQRTDLLPGQLEPTRQARASGPGGAGGPCQVRDSPGKFLEKEKAQTLRGPLVSPLFTLLEDPGF